MPKKTVIELDRIIYTAMKKIYEQESRDQYGQIRIMSYQDYQFKNRIQPKLWSDVLEHMKSGNSRYGRLSAYGWTYGNYYAMPPNHNFYEDYRNDNTVSK